MGGPDSCMYDAGSRDLAVRGDRPADDWYPVWTPQHDVHLHT